MGFNSRRQRQEPVRKPRINTDTGAFRRSRTLTGSISSRVVAAVEHASQLKSPRLEEHELRGHRRKLSTLLLFSLAGVGCLTWLIDVTIVRMQPATEETHEGYIALVDAYLSAHPLERISPTLNSSALLRSVQSKAPEVAAITVSGDDRFALHTVSVTKRTPVAQWKLGTDIYLVDADGVAYQDLRANTQGLLQVKDESGLPLASQRVASRQTMQFIGRVVSQLQTKGSLKVVEVILPPGLLKQIDVVIENRPYRVKLNTDRSAQGQASDVIATLRYIDTQQISPKYIDTRVEGKAFYQ